MDREIKFGIDIRFDDGQIVDLTEFLNKMQAENEQLKQQLAQALKENEHLEYLYGRKIGITNEALALLTEVADASWNEIRAVQERVQALLAQPKE